MLINPMLPYIPPYRPLSNITPFTYRDGLTYADEVSSIRDWLNKVVDFVNANFTELGDSFSTEVNRLVESVNEIINEQTSQVNEIINEQTSQVNDTLATNNAAIDSKIVELSTYVNNLVQQIINSSVEVSDPVMVQAIENLDSLSRQLLDSIYTPRAVNSSWLDDAKLMHAHQSSRGMSEVNVLVFGADPTGNDDSTDAINTAIETAKVFKVGSVFIPAGRYLINGTINITHEVRVRGQYTAFAPSDGSRVAGTVLIAGNNAAGSPVILAKNPTAGGYLAGVAVEDIFIIGSAGWTDGSGSKDRVALAFTKVISEFKISGVMITGFLREGILFEEVYDGTIFNSRLLHCGTAGTYPAIHYKATPQGNTNSVHSFGIHVESCPFMLKVDGGSRHNSFVASKFELFAKAPLTSPIQISNSRETTFVGCYFVSRNSDDPLYSNAGVQPHFFDVNYSEAIVTLVDCNMNTAPYTGAPLVEPELGTSESFDGGARWVKVSNGRFQFKGGSVRVAWCGSGAQPFILGKGSSVVDSVLYTGSKSGGRSLFELKGEARVVGCEILPQNASATPTGGSLFNCSGARNIIGPNIINGGVFSHISTTVQQTVTASSDDAVTYASGTSLDMGWPSNSRHATSFFILNMSSPTSVTEFTNGWLHREIVVRFGNSNTTLVHSSQLLLKGGANVSPPANGYMRFLAHAPNVWVEISRNF